MVATANILVRRARPADAAQLTAILHDTFESTWRRQISAASARDFVTRDRPAAYVARHGLDVWVAERDGAVVGLVHWQDDFVHALHVPSRHARSGVGSRLMDSAEAAIARSGFAAVRLETDTFNAASQSFYKARGYREADRYPDVEWNSDLTTILFVKALG